MPLLFLKSAKGTISIVFRLINLPVQASSNPNRNKPISLVRQDFDIEDLFRSFRIQLKRNGGVRAFLKNTNGFGIVIRVCILEHQTLFRRTGKLNNFHWTPLWRIKIPVGDITAGFHLIEIITNRSFDSSNRRNWDACYPNILFTHRINHPHILARRISVALHNAADILWTRPLFTAPKTFRRHLSMHYQQIVKKDSVIAGCNAQRVPGFTVGGIIDEGISSVVCPLCPDFGSAIGECLAANRIRPCIALIAAERYPAILEKADNHPIRPRIKTEGLAGLRTALRRRPADSIKLIPIRCKLVLFPPLNTPNFIIKKGFAGINKTSIL